MASDMQMAANRFKLGGKGARKGAYTSGQGLRRARAGTSGGYRGTGRQSMQLPPDVVSDLNASGIDVSQRVE